MTGRPGRQPNSRQASPQPTGRSPLGFGEGLRRAREERGLSLQEVAGQTHLRLDLLRALEAEDLAALPERTLARSFLQNYARALGLDPAPLLQEFDRRLPLPQQMRPMQPRTARGRNRRPPSSSGLLGGVLGGVLLLGVAGYFGYSAYQAQGGTRTRATDPVALPSTRQVRLSLNSVPSGARVYLDNRYLGLTPVQDFPLDARPQASLRVEYPGLPTYQAPVDLNADRHLTLTLKPLTVQPPGSGVPAATSSGPASPGAGPSAATPSTPGRPAAPATSPAAQPGAGTVQPTPAPTAAETPPGGAAPASGVRLSFSGTSWVRVTSSSGQLLYQGIPSVGSRRDFPGGVTVRVGSAGAVTATPAGGAPQRLGAVGQVVTRRF